MQLFSRILLQVLSSFHLFPFLFQISDSFDLKYVREQVKGDWVLFYVRMTLFQI